MKSKRHSKILEIIRENEIETQEELINMLRDEGLEVTQATVSRDIRELGLTKKMSRKGNYIYSVNEPTQFENRSLYSNAMANSVKSVEYALNQIVIKTYPGMAQAVAAGLDTLNNNDILGCVAGDDCIIAVIKSVEMTPQIADTISKMFEIK